MGFIDNLGKFDPDKHALTRDYDVISKAEIQGRKVVPDKYARALKDYVKGASEAQKKALEAVVTAAKGSRLKAIQKFLTSAESGSDSRVQMVFTAHKSHMHTPPPPPTAQAMATPQKAATLPVADAAIKEINAALQTTLPTGISSEDASEVIALSLEGILMSKEPMKEGQLHKIAKLAETNPGFFSQVEPALKDHLIHTSNVLKGGGFSRHTACTPSSGVYFGSYHGVTRIVVKPALEEYKTPYNPNRGFLVPGIGSVSAKGDVGTALRHGHFSGDAAQRECAAYITDKSDGLFARTPPTIYVRIQRRDPMVKEPGSAYKTCAIQAYLQGRPVEKSDLTTLRQEELERLAYADIDEGNADRHFSGNLFLRKDGSLQRIDQGLTRGTAPDDCRFDWRQLSQLTYPMLPQTIEKIEKQNLSERLHILQSIGIPKEAIELEKARILLKKEGAKAGLTFYDISGILQPRPGAEGKTECMFSDMMQRAKSSSIESEISQAVATVKQWKDHVEGLYVTDRTQAWKTAKESPFPHLREAMIIHLKHIERRV